MNKLKEIRLKKHLSIRKLADIAELSYVTIWNAENNRCKLQEHNQQKVADALNVERKEIL